MKLYVQHIAHDIMEKRGMSESRAISIAIGVVKNPPASWDANAKAAAAKAAAEWEAKKGSKSGKLGEASSVALADKVALRSQAKARLRAIEEAFGAQMMAALMEADSGSWSPELKRTASGSSEIERHEVHDGGQHVGYVTARPGYGVGSARGTRYAAKAVNGRMVAEVADSKAKALDGLKKHLEEAPARVTPHKGGRFLVANPDSYSGPTTMTEYPSQSSARYAAGLPEKPTSVEQRAKVVALGEMVGFDLLTLELLGEELPREWQGLLLEEADTPFSAGDRVNYQHPTAGRVKARVVKVTSRHVHVRSPDPRVSPARMTHREAAAKLSLTSKPLSEGFAGFDEHKHPRGAHGKFTISGLKVGHVIQFSHKSPRGFLRGRVTEKGAGHVKVKLSEPGTNQNEMRVAHERITHVLAPGAKPNDWRQVAQPGAAARTRAEIIRKSPGAEREAQSYRDTLRSARAKPGAKKPATPP